MNYLGLYHNPNPDQHGSGLFGLNGIFGAPTYNYVGSAGFADNYSDPHDGADVFVGGNHADVFNGLGGPFGPQDPGSDTVDYSGAGSAVYSQSVDRRDRRTAPLRATPSSRSKICAARISTTP